MQGSDDYETDDIVFDAQTLAFLDEQEEKYIAQRSLEPPPRKRQRTDHGRVSGVARTASVDGFEDLPEISLRDDGTYSLHGRGNTSQTRSSRPTANVDLLPSSQGAALQHQLEELRRENKQIRMDLQAALDMKYSKEGEVAILRKGVEKTAQIHAAQVAKLKSAKEEADTKRAQIQKDMKDEMERLRTQFTFRQHEIETSSLKPPWSVRSKKIAETNKSSMLPGFHNAFIPSTPTRSDVRYNPIHEEGDFPVLNTLGVDIPEVDVEMADCENSPKHVDGIESLDWNEELQRIILTHSPPASTTLTLHMLMGLSLPSELPARSAEAYPAACSDLLQTLAITSKFHDLEVTIHAISNALMEIAKVLTAAHSITALTALLNLLSLLIFSLPTFSFSLLSDSHPKGQSAPKMLAILSDIIRDHLAPQKQSDKNVDLASLAKETFGFLEALCWNIPNELAGRLVCAVLNPDIMSTILNTSQPPWMLSRSTRLLVLLATHADLLRHPLFPLSDEKHHDEDEYSKDLREMLHIDKLCSYLIDTDRQGEDADSMRIHILTFIAILSVSHAEALPVLLESPTLILSLVLFLAQLATPIWEVDETLMESPAIVESSIRTLNQGLFLLHHLVFGTEPSLNLRHKLHHSHHRPFNGITHIFIVTLGRLSYADPPDWVAASGKAELESMAEIARDLLEAVVEGPEGDSIWAVYQSLSEQESDTDAEDWVGNDGAANS